MKYLIFLCSICLLNNFLSFQLFVFSALWSSQPFELPSFLVSKLFGPPKLSLVLQPPVAWLLLILRTGSQPALSGDQFALRVSLVEELFPPLSCTYPIHQRLQCVLEGIVKPHPTPIGPGVKFTFKRLVAS